MARKSMSAAALYAFDNHGLAVADYFRTRYPYDLVARWIGTGRYLAIQSQQSHWRHLGVVHGSPSLLRELLVDGWTSVHVGARHLVVWAQPRITRTEHELVFDLDLNDWDDPKKRPAQLRRGILCDCANTQPDRCCRDCWVFVELAHVVLSSRFPASKFGPPLWVFSGGKGAHCWFGSPHARTLPAADRQKLRTELEQWHLPAPPPDLCIDALYQSFLSKVVGGRRQLFARPLAWDWLRAQTRQSVRCSNSESTLRWTAFAQAAEPTEVKAVVLAFALPLVDTQVTGDRHLVKLPFSVHTRTQRLAIPVATEALDTFDPATAPSVADPLPPSALALVSDWLSQ